MYRLIHNFSGIDYVFLFSDRVSFESGRMDSASKQCPALNEGQQDYLAEILDKSPWLAVKFGDRAANQGEPGKTGQDML